MNEQIEREGQAIETLYQYVHNNKLDERVLNQLATPFDPDVISWKPGATTKDKARALALAYADPRAYTDRLNEIAIGEWHDDYDIIPFGDRVFITCRLTIFGVTRVDVGEEPLGQSDERFKDNALTSAVAQAFKRACVKFGLGAYLYSLPQEWAEYDSQKRRFSDKGLQFLNDMLRHHTGNSGKRVGGDPGLAALMSTPKGTELGTCTPLQLQTVIQTANNPKLIEGAETLLLWISKHFGPTAEEKTYNELKDQVE